MLGSECLLLGWAVSLPSNSLTANTGAGTCRHEMPLSSFPAHARIVFGCRLREACQVCHTLGLWTWQQQEPAWVCPRSEVAASRNQVFWNPQD